MLPNLLAHDKDQSVQTEEAWVRAPNQGVS